MRFTLFSNNISLRFYLTYIIFRKTNTDYVSSHFLKRTFWRAKNNLT